METRTTDAKSFQLLFPSPNTPYASVAFNELNRDKCDAVEHLVFYGNDGHACAGLIIGRKNGVWCAPFSAPFGEFCLNKTPGIEKSIEIVESLKAHFSGEPIEITLPAPFYAPDEYSLFTAALASRATRFVFDYNYHYPLSQVADVRAYMQPNARNKYTQALRSGLTFAQTYDTARAYAIIEANRRSKGYNLAMSLNQVKDTIKIVDADFFILSLGDTDVAAAMVYRLNSRIAQVIYWGDAPGYSALRPMNILPFHIFRHYAEAGFDIVDVGPASTDGIPNIGLCAYKESIGCHPTLKPTFRLN